MSKSAMDNSPRPELPPTTELRLMLILGADDASPDSSPIIFEKQESQTRTGDIASNADTWRKIVNSRDA